MSRGGKREGAGRPSKWMHKQTKLIRVPVAFADNLLDIARRLDKGEPLAVNRPRAFTQLGLNLLPPDQLFADSDSSSV